MTKANQQASSFLAKLVAQPTDTPAQPLQVRKAEPPNAFRSVFDIQELDRSHAQDLEDLMLEGPSSEARDSAKIKQDLDMIKSITAEIKSIQKQSVLLLGERIFRAREILQHYGDGNSTFTKWLDRAFTSRRTAYNCLSYYEFYHALPNEHLKGLLKEMSYKAVYMLASREGKLEKKMQIVEKFYGMKQDEIIPIIQETFPVVHDATKAKHQAGELIEEIIRAARLLLKEKKALKQEHHMRLCVAQSFLSRIISSYSSQIF